MAEYSIVKNDKYKWTTTQGSYLDEVPRIFAKTYKIKDNEIYNTVASWLDSITNFSGDYKKFYDNLHRTKPNTDTWVFPYFDDTVRGFSNEWGSNVVNSTGGGNVFFGDLASGARSVAERFNVTKGIIEQIADTTVGKVTDTLQTTGSLYEPPKFYQYGVTDGPVTVEFTLINTESEGDFSNNYDLVKKLITENRFRRDNGFLTEAPVLWSVTIPGYRAIRWASCDVNVSLLGKRAMKDNKIAPEGYRVALTFKSLYTEPSNFMKDATQGGSL
jgi:hypothetical protein